MEAKPLRDHERSECRQFVEDQIRSLSRKIGKLPDVRLLTQDVIELLDDSCKLITPDDFNRVCDNVVKGNYGQLSEIKLISASFFQWMDAIHQKKQSFQNSGNNKSDISKYSETIRSAEHKKAVDASLRAGKEDSKCFYSLEEYRQLNLEFGEKWDDLVQRSETAFTPDYGDDFEERYAAEMKEFEQL